VVAISRIPTIAKHNITPRITVRDIRPFDETGVVSNDISCDEYAEDSVTLLEEFYS